MSKRAIKAIVDSIEANCQVPTKQHIEFLIKAEKTYPGLHWDRSSINTIYFSYPGYKHMDFYEVMESLRKLGCKLDFDKGYEEFDQMCGRTFCHLIEPKAGA